MPANSLIYGRNERIRTSDPLTPSQVRYLAALRSEHLKALGYKGFSGKRFKVMELSNAGWKVLCGIKISMKNSDEIFTLYRLAKMENLLDYLNQQWVRGGQGASYANCEFFLDWP